MASHLIRPVRQLLAFPTRHLRAPAQRRWAQVHDVRFLATAEPPRAVIERYREKLDQKAREQGYGDLEELKTAYSEKIATVRQKMPHLAPPPRPRPADPLRRDSRRHLRGHGGCRALGPQFVLPVPHPEQGAEIHFLQWTFDAASNTSTVLFTQLAEYKARGEFAQPHTTITHHKDLLDERGLVLMQGQVVENRGAKVEDARFLVLCLQKFYGAWEESGQPRAERKQLLDWFANGDPNFTIDKLLEETERMV
ncbi:unnamed protein product [Parascedosporium putredinis]|uniref:ATP11-domain-containing protein n=1 Tax=Parascedosporium putredinis TaxID=1442378 RepID=A0A9P1MB75_9PEZI|nr:unnamed protein product [Parascedosporium putredinis]CAI7998974.1 unnamed protein product [Parascedosporium putredinis]